MNKKNFKQQEKINIFKLSIDDLDFQNKLKEKELKMLGVVKKINNNNIKNTYNNNQSMKTISINNKNNSPKIKKKNKDQKLKIIYVQKHLKKLEI